MLVSCIIPTYKKFDYLYDAILSVLNQDYSNIELIITDDCSGNFPRHQLIEYIESNRKANLYDYKIIEHEINYGTVKNMNNAIKSCEGELIMPLASDDFFFDNGVISKVVERFLSEKCKVLVCSRMAINEKSGETIGLLPNKAFYSEIQKIDSADKGFRALILGKTYSMASGSSMYYDACFIKNNLYDENYLLWEDGPFIARCFREGVCISQAYDITSIYYRTGGISDNKASNIPEKIYKDYCKYIDNEFLRYPDRLSYLDKRILMGRDYYLKKKFQFNISTILRYPEFAINFLLVFLKKKILIFKDSGKLK